MLSAAVAAARAAVRPVLQAVNRQGMVLVACSGGVDSLALAAAVAFEAPRAGLSAGAAVVDHGLLEGSAGVARRAAAQCEQLGLTPVVIERVNVPLDSPDGVEAAARAARYAALCRAAAKAGATLVLLAHTMDDQAETVLMALARGAGATALAGMAAEGQLAALAGRDPGDGPPSAGPGDGDRDPGAAGALQVADLAVVARQGAGGPGRSQGHAMPAGGSRFARPFLGLTRAQTEAVVRDAGLEPWRDPTNYPGGPHPSLRAEVRARVMPVLAEVLGPGVPGALARTADRLRQDQDLLEDQAALLLEEATRAVARGGGGAGGGETASGDGKTLELDAATLARAHPALRGRALRRAALQAGATPGALGRAHVEALGALAADWRGQGPADLPGGIRAGREYGKLVFRAKAAHQQAQGDTT
ncbi:MAG: tRNA lysidine(34) synthetase TilS [Bifidobacteriaceae bacterium]|jgi:tRNA(Ile)-lysidine synthase|nr:tRNA lysidine(34) synthetase TilS [Bifidobacteriaceae bacterium]